jgi:hypothetical protein
VIKGNESVGAGNFTAVIGARRVLTIDNKVSDASNACLDHWGSYSDVYVRAGWQRGAGLYGQHGARRLCRGLHPR